MACWAQDKDQDSPQVAALALAAAKELSIAHLGAGIDEAYSASMSEYRSTKLDRGECVPNVYLGQDTS